MTVQQTSTLTPTRGAPAQATPSRRRRRAYAELTLISLVVGISAWWLVVALHLANPVLLPPPPTVVRSMVEMLIEGTLLVHVA
ncbi:MAG: hypothetical protein HY691_03150, partial [Chloroflexi bacterium]|nr:hypothetical protein [Chloroflexota bacterium]